MRSKNKQRLTANNYSLFISEAVSLFIFHYKNGAPEIREHRFCTTVCYSLCFLVKALRRWEAS